MLEILHIYSFIFFIIGLLLIASCISYKINKKFGMPEALVFLAVGILAGSEGIGGIRFESYHASNFVGTAALTLILYSGGLDTDIKIFNRSCIPSIVLSTLGVLLVAIFTAIIALILGLGLFNSLLIGAIVSSTDASAVFSILKDVPLTEKIANIIKLESGINDPMAVILVIGIVSVMGPNPLTFPDAILFLMKQVVFGLIIGFLCGYVGKKVIHTTEKFSTSFIFSLGLALISFGLASVIDGSGFLAVFITGVLVGSAKFKASKELFLVHDSISWLAHVAMFLMLGLLVFPSSLLHIMWYALIIAIAIAIISRPLAVFICLLPFKFDKKETAFISWAGLRGAMPIVIATIPILASNNNITLYQSSINVFNIVFFIVVIGTIIPGVTLKYFAEKLGINNSECRN